MLSVYLAQDLQQAELLRQRLSQNGIQAVVRNGFLQGALGELPLTVHPEVCVVSERDFEAARRCVEELERALRAPAEQDVRCGKCGEENPANFEICWKCRAELDV